MLSRTQLRQFLAVVDTGNFTRAASSLNIAQPSLSAGIAELERQLGTRLFVRERRRIGLTPAGNELLPLARGIERTFHRAETQVGSLPVPLRPIRLGVLETLALDWLEAIVAGYRGAEPLELVEGSARELQAALASESLDLALTILPPGGRGEGQALLEETLLPRPAGSTSVGRSRAGCRARCGGRDDDCPPVLRGAGRDQPLLHRTRGAPALCAALTQ